MFNKELLVSHCSCSRASNHNSPALIANKQYVVPFNTFPDRQQMSYHADQFQVRNGGLKMSALGINLGQISFNGTLAF
uniref:Uncharacterized protein n=1 Tax=Timema monikensis TaxID=170555 RepID=A0A7R9HV42_9NEOP|nr:unnamed protein product [Timema monikensis]